MPQRHEIGRPAAIAALVAVFAMLDSFGCAIDRTGSELTQNEPERVLVQLDTFYPTDSDVITAIADAAAVGAASPGLRLPAVALAVSDTDRLDLLIEIVDLDEALWTPTIERSGDDPGAGISLASKAADDLDVDQIDRFGLDETANIVHAVPAAGADRNDLQRALFELDGVTSSQAVAQISESFDNALEQFMGFLVITAAAVLSLALLIAFNATRISVDERRREHATMRAFGLPVRSIMGVVIKEGVLVGVLAKLIGVVTSTLFLRVMLRSLATTTLPDLEIDASISPTTLIIAVLVGIVAVAMAPLFLTRRISTMDIPDTLRVME